MGLWNDLAEEALAEILMRWIDSGSSDVKDLERLLADGNPFSPGSRYPQRIWQQGVKGVLLLVRDNTALLTATLASARETLALLDRTKKERKS